MSYIDTRTRTDVSQKPVTWQRGSDRKTTTMYPTGTAKSITSVRTQRGERAFVPGQFRYRSCTILEGSCKASSRPYAESNFQINGSLTAWLLKATGFDNGCWWQSTLPSSPPSWLVNAARIKSANKRLDNAYAGGTFLAELKDSLSMIVNPLKGCHKILKTGLTRALRFRTKARRKEYMTSYWLEARYGWIPLASDISEIYSRIMLGLQKSNSFFVSHGSEKLSTTTTTRRVLSYSTWMRLHVDVIDVYDYRVRATNGWEYVIGHESEEMWSAVGLHPNDIPGILWETTTLSFAVDWWLNVGSFLKYLRPTPWLKNLGEGYSITTKARRLIIPVRLEYKWKDNAYIGDIRVPTDHVEITQRAYQRVIPTGDVKAPVFDPRFNSVKHLADAAALITQKLWR